MNVLHKDVIIAIGAAAAGKTTLLNHLEEKFTASNLTVFRVSDLDMLLQIVDEDMDHLHHIRLANDQFEVTNPWVYNEAVSRVCGIVESQAQFYDVILAEIACGSGTDIRFDISFSHRIGLIPESVVKRSRILHVENPLESRIRLNEGRVGFAHTPEHVFHGLFEEDQYHVDTLKIPGGIIETISNRGSLDLFLNTANAMFGFT